MISLRKKAQAAMEFLMTYGWAILVVLIAISALTYFGVLNPSKFLPEKCDMVPGLNCIDHKVTTTQIQLVINNGMGQDLKNFTISMNDCTAPILSNYTFQDATKNTFTLTGCNNGESGDRFKKSLSINFTSESGLTHTEPGQIITKVE